MRRRRSLARVAGMYSAATQHPLEHTRMLGHLYSQDMISTALCTTDSAHEQFHHNCTQTTSASIAGITADDALPDAMRLKFENCVMPASEPPAADRRAHLHCQHVRRRGQLHPGGTGGPQRAAAAAAAGVVPVVDRLSSGHSVRQSGHARQRGQGSASHPASAGTNRRSFFQCAMVPTVVTNSCQ